MTEKVGQKSTDGSQSIGKKTQRGFLARLSDYTDTAAKASAVAGAGVAITGVGLPAAAGLETSAAVMEGISIASGLLDKIF